MPEQREKKDKPLAQKSRHQVVAGVRRHPFVTVLALVFLVLCSFLAYVALVGISIDASFLHGKVSALAVEHLGRSVTVGGPSRLTISLTPGITLRDIEGDSQSPAPPDTIRIAKFSARAAVLPLLRGRIHIIDALVEDAVIDLVTPERKRSASEENTEEATLSFDLDRFELRRVKLSYHDRQADRTYRLYVNEAKGLVEWEGTVRCDLQGKVGELPIGLSLKGGGLGELLSRTRPWPLALSGQLGGSVISLDGTIAGPSHGGEFDFSVSLQGEGFADLESLLGSSPPDAGPFDLNGRIRGGGGSYDLSELDGRIGENIFSGALSLDTRGVRPRVGGEVLFEKLDAGRLPAVPPSPEPAGGSPAVERGSTDTPLPVRYLRACDGEAKLAIREIVGAPYGLERVSMGLGIEDGILTVDLTDAAAVGTVMTGSLTADGRDEKLKVRASLSTEQLDLKALEAVTALSLPMTGRIGSLSVDAVGGGMTPAELLNSLRLELTAVKADLTLPIAGDDSDLRVRLDRATADLSPGWRLTMAMSGSAEARLPSLAASVDHFSLSLRGSGKDAAALADSLEAEMKAAGADAEYRFIEKDAKSRLHLDTAAVRIERGRAFRLEGTGSLEGEGPLLEGSAGHVDVALWGEGSDREALLSSLGLRLDVVDAAFAYGVDPDADKTVGVDLGEARVEILPGEGVTAVLDGSLLGETFSADFSGGKLVLPSHENPWPVDLTVRGAESHIVLKGTLEPTAGETGPRMDFSARGEKVGDLAPWLGVPPEAALAYSVSGGLLATEGALTIDLAESRIGRSDFSGRLSGRRVDGKNTFEIRLESRETSLEELALFSTGGERQGPASLDIPLLAGEVQLPDGLVDVEIARLAGKNVSFEKIAAQGRFQENTASLSLRYSIYDADFSGSLDLGLESGGISLSVDAAAENVDLGRLLEDAGIFEGLDASAEMISLSIVAEGRTLRELLEDLEISALAESGNVTLKDLESEARIDVALRKAEVSMRPHAATTVTAEGDVRGETVRFTAAASALKEILSSPGRLPLKLRVEFGDDVLELEGHQSFPLAQREFAFDFSLSGERLDLVSPEGREGSPPPSPYSLEGRVEVVKGGYRFSEMRARIGESSLGGEVELVTGGAKPEFRMDLAAETLQLDDLFGREGDEDDTPDGSPEKPSQIEEEESSDDEERKLDSWLPQFLQGFNGRLSVVAGRVLSGEDFLGSAKLVLTVDQGRMALEPLRLEHPEGGGDVVFSVDTSGEKVQSSLKVDIDRFDYGSFARIFDRKAKTTGLISLHIDITSSASTFGELLEGADGRFVIGIRPEGLSGHVFDLWAANLLVALMPVVDKEKESKVNCVVGNFSMDDGVMKSEIILLDTTRVVVKGKGTVDLVSEQLDIYLKPKPKKAAFFSLANPVRLEGGFDNYETKVAGGVMRLINIILVPLKRIFTKPPPPDDREACRKALEL